ncbi:MAG: hypothetical protein H6513_11285 [Acidimicrobiaceae bacterium]|nr:hypothetical protein [Ilumatobacter sp.]MCB9381262.1 hypothetical protein [Acidimicrobiaceae bacterium]MCO5330109.1 hypothetical protein [Ilumatobacteraceae bacterium]
MAFGQASGPPASGRQVKELLELLQRAGHADFRDARGPMGFTQRQAAGKFTAQEAAELIERLQEDEHRRETGEVGSGPHAAPVPSSPAPVRRQSSPRAPAADPALRGFSDDRLAAELQRRGWIVVEP